MFMSIGGAAIAGACGSVAMAGEQAGRSAASSPPLPAADRRNLDAVMGMSAAWKSSDVQKIAAFMHDDLLFRGSFESKPISGKKAFVDAFSGIFTKASIDMIVLDAFALDPVVMTCHHQLFDWKDRGPQEDLFIGSFFMQDGKIREWYDYGIVPCCRPRQADTATKGRFFHVPV